ncbi:MAG TPA: hypothetical protein VIX17_11535 [Pyrinomonadaceae bacterium]|jgi:uncharacterized protein Yka (UPF0111/DUF47 family)
MKRNPTDSTLRNARASKGRRDDELKEMLAKLKERVKGSESLVRSLFTDVNKRYNELAKRVSKLEAKK